MTDDPALFFANAQQDFQSATCDFFAITNTYELRKPQITNDIEQIVKDVFYNPVSEHVLTSDELRVKSYDPSVLQNDGILWRLAIKDVPNLAALNKQLGLPVDEIEEFDDDDKIGEIRGFIARIQTKAGVVCIFQKLAQNTVLKSSFAYKFIYSGATFSKIDADAMFQISAANNCAFLIAHKVYLLEPGPFEYIFDYKQKKIELAEQKSYEITKSIESSLTLPTGKSLWDFIGNQKRLIDKLQKLDVTAMPTPEQLMTTNQKYGLALDVTDGKLHVSTAAEAKKLVTAINEDYVESVTGKKFETHSKERVE